MTTSAATPAPWSDIRKLGHFHSNYINYFARRIAEVYNRGASTPCPPLGEDPVRDSCWRHFAVLCLVKGDDVTLEDVHDAWAAWSCDTQIHHPHIVPFGELDEASQESNAAYRDAIREVARARSWPARSAR